MVQMEIATDNSVDFKALPQQLAIWAKQLGFAQLAISDIELEEDKKHLQHWLSRNFHGEMAYMQRHADKRGDPALLEPGTVRVITVRFDHLPDATPPQQVLDNPNQGYVARYALGRDYHKLMRKRLAKLAKLLDQHLQQQFKPGQYRALVDSAPVLEKALAQKAGLGWIGKNTLLLNKQAGSWFFLGEIYTNVPLPISSTQTPTNHCGNCSRCIDVCPTQAIVAPYQLDARRCISYLTIELKGVIPEPLRKAMGNRIFGCDDCQLVCPWNRFAQHSQETDFNPRHQLDGSELLTLFNWTEPQFLKNTEGSAIRRTGFLAWQRNIAVALGNAPASAAIKSALSNALGENDMVDEHIVWALQQQQQKVVG